VVTPLDRWLAEQRQLSAVDRFSAEHDRGGLPAAGRWHELMPATPPGPGEQYAFAVDLDACTGCKSCVAACHSLNGLDEGETWRSVGLLVGTDAPVRQHVTTACHHCLDPACLSGCPVDAYEKDPFTGIVRHLDDQCIGCRYCTLTCPYEVPRYNASLGIVRKCDLCADRLSDGEAPACAQACPTNAISVTVVSTDAARAIAGFEGEALVPSAPPSALTMPTTVYRTTRSLDGVVAADEDVVVPAHAHPPLVAMLLLTQLAVGIAATQWLLRLVAPEAIGVTHARLSAAIVAGSGLVAMAASVLHLGRPHLAWRAVRGIGHSWLSREIVAFGAFGAVSGIVAAARLTDVGPAWVDGSAGDGVVALVGLAGVATSAAVYAATGKRWWRLAPTLGRFGLTTVATGTAASALLMAAFVTADVVSADRGRAVVVALLIAALLAVAVAAATDLVAGRVGRRDAELDRTAILLAGPLRSLASIRRALHGLAATLGLITIAIVAGDGPNESGAVVVLAALALTVLAAEAVGRHLWFLAVSGARMPGPPR
jgi:Fe-S-cluster-containing dehydrogenase component/DMSO reductase anchor subunit